MSRVFLVTANVGSVFENIDVGLPVWLNELTAKIQLDNPDFIALHFQETGGKDYDNGNYKVIQNFFGILIDAFETAGYNLLEGIVDSEADVKPEFTALSSAYFICKNCTTPIQIWDFGTNAFVALSSASSGKLFTGKEINSNSWNQKEKFPQHFFPNCEWSRKGFARTRWRLGGTSFDLVNIHLFHDSHNLIAASTFPSPFSQYRQRALNFTLEKFRNDDLEQVPLFIFGDFNFRVNTFDIFDILRKEAASVEMSNAPPTPAIVDGTPPSDDAFLSADLVIDAKRFSLSNHEQRFKEDWGWLRAYDFESSQFETLKEFEVQFHPTYPFDESDPEKFMKTRCPAWCDRILFTHDSESIISKEPAAEYNLIGSRVCMGDHKPVYLKFNLKSYPSSNLEPHSSQAPLSSIESPPLLDDLAGITVNQQRSRCRFVSFFRRNLGCNEATKSPVVKAPGPFMASTATTTEKGYFLKIRNSDTGESTSLTNNRNKERGKPNILPSPEAKSNPLGGLDGEKLRGDGKPVEIEVMEVRNSKANKVKEISKSSKKSRAAKGNNNGEDGSNSDDGCWSGCQIC